MNRTFLLLMCALSVISLVVAGCGGRRRGGPGTGTDGGPRDLGDPITVDSGGVDLGGIMFDLGPMVDLGRDMGRDMGSSCTPTPIDYAVGPYCTGTTTRSCFEACTDGPCQTSCLAADPSTDCPLCVNQNLIACANANGCTSAWDAFVCCADTNCPTGSASTCVDTYCTPESDAFSACANEVLTTATCTEDYTSCF